jgi:hypothetical protein
MPMQVSLKCDIVRCYLPVLPSLPSSDFFEPSTPDRRFHCILYGSFSFAIVFYVFIYEQEEETISVNASQSVINAISPNMLSSGCF